MAIKRGAPEYQGQDFYCHAGQHLLKFTRMPQTKETLVTCAVCDFATTANTEFLVEIGVVEGKQNE